MDFKRHSFQKERKSFTEAFQFPSQTNHFSSLDLNNNDPFMTFKSPSNNTKSTRKQNEHPKSQLQKLLNAIDDYINYLNESQEFETQQSETIEEQLVLKFNIIKEKHEKQIKKLKHIEQKWKVTNVENAFLKNQIIELQHQLEEEQNKHSYYEYQYRKMKKQFSGIKQRNEFLVNSLLHVKLKKDLQSLQESTKNSDLSLVYKAYSNHQNF